MKVEIEQRIVVRSKQLLEVDLPEVPVYAFIYGVRELYAIIPIWGEQEGENKNIIAYKCICLSEEGLIVFRVQVSNLYPVIAKDRCFTQAVEIIVKGVEEREKRTAIQFKNEFHTFTTNINAFLV